ncbi:MAG: PstS family phosphate ABC transporter substrate-binding protein [Candidatus Omnitrophica bacterium]|nr:PstS family phosphate ABC transporter substrate-binding protein [Candidatus Omnitrophota bacterium]
MKKIMSLFLIGMFAASTAFAGNMIQIKGSDTLINTVQKLAEDYMAKNPGASISVTGGGSGTGVAALINKKCDIANSSRTIKDTEIAAAQANGVDVKRVIVALDGVAIIVNAANPVKELTVEQIGKIYKGDIKNWKEVGGENMPIGLYGRQPNSGTFSFVQEMAVKGDYSGSMRQMNGNSQIIEAVNADKGAVGYVGAGYAKEATGVTVLNVALKAGGEFVSPLVETNIQTGKYPLSRPLNQYLNGVPTGAVKDFIAYEVSDEGQKVVEEMGFFALSDDYKNYNKALGL